MIKEALFYQKLPGKRVRCNLCRIRCNIAPGKRGLCGVRENRDGVLYTLVYGKPIALNVDPIEKKPLFHFLPGSRAFSIATVGCNFHCDFCQNWDISQIGRDGRIEGYDVPPEKVVELAEEYSCQVIAYTYTEPVIFYEYAKDTALLAVERGMKNVFVTNGYITEEALRDIRPYLHGVNIDLKGWSEEYYRKIIGARLSEVLDSLRLHRKLGIWLEVTTLIVPGWNDSERDIREIARFVRDELGDWTPWHISRFYPHYRMRNYPPTPLSVLEMAYEIGKEEGLKYVYLGNVPGHKGENTYCPNCGRLVIGRVGFSITEYHLDEKGKCQYCGYQIHGVFH